MQLYPTGCICLLKIHTGTIGIRNEVHFYYKNDRFSLRTINISMTRTYIGDAFHSLARNNTTYIREIEKLRRLTLIITDYDY